jgi:peptidoglycan/LPS O-acetylase OafA/YrhL
MQKTFFPFVDVLRAIAVTLVLGFHLIAGLQWNSFPSSGLLVIFHHGGIGVDLFFVISGFVISLSCARNVQEHGRENYRRPFFASRLARIVPLYALTSWCFLVLVEPGQFFGPSKQLLKNILLHATFLHSLSPRYAGTLNGPTWTIGVEMQFYVFMALVWVWLPVRRPALVALTGVVVALAWRAVAVLSFDYGTDIQRLVLRVAQVPGMLDEFALGCVLAIIVQNPAHPAHRFTTPSWRNFAIAAVPVCVLSAAAWQIFFFALTRIGYWNSLVMVTLFHLLQALTFSCWLWAAIVLPVTPQLTALLKPATYIGKISYGIYLWHMLVIMSLVRAGVAAGLPAWKTALLITVLTVIISAFTWHYFEHPIMKRHASRKRFLLNQTV